MSNCCRSSGCCGTLLFRGNTVPFTGGNINIRRENVPSNPISYGKDPKQRTIYNYSKGKTIVEGNFTIEVFGSGGYGNAFADLLRFALNPPCASLDGGSGSGGALNFSPNGATEIDIPGSGGQAVVSSFTINGNSGANVTAVFNFLSTTYRYGASSIVSVPQFETAGTSDDSNPIPWYSVGFVLTGAGGESFNINNYLIDWSLTCNLNPLPVYTFCDVTTTEANKIQLGILKPSGSFKYWAPDGVFNDSLRDGGSLAITLGSVTLRCPNVAFINDLLPNEGNNAAVFRTVNFECFGSEGRAALYA